eukprot:63463-Pelagomonas_calceolata.AAC.2
MKVEDKAVVNAVARRLKGRQREEHSISIATWERARSIVHTSAAHAFIALIKAAAAILLLKSAVVHAAQETSAAHAFIALRKAEAATLLVESAAVHAAQEPNATAAPNVQAAHP